MTVARDPALSVWTTLQPGTVIFIHNTRVLHGRSSFQATSGRRLDGCYLNNEEFRSRLRVLARRYDVS
jgi:gamma-butyrobetaine dioxygenase